MSAILTAVTFVAPRALPTFSAKGVTLPNTKWLAEAYASTDIDCVHLPPEDPDFKVFSVQPSPSREILTEADVAKISRFDGFANSVRAATDDLNQVLQEVEKGNKASVLATTVFDLNNVSFTSLLFCPINPSMSIFYNLSSPSRTFLSRPSSSCVPRTLTTCPSQSLRSPSLAWLLLPNQPAFEWRHPGSNFPEVKCAHPGDLSGKWRSP